jgi:hypothetical protein
VVVSGQTEHVKDLKMLISFRRTGGFANLVVNVQMNSANMAQDKVTELEKLVGKALPFTQGKVEPAADVCHYSLSIENGDTKTTVEANDLTVTDNMQTLFEFIMDEGNH